jgi:hypothetical protein
MASITAQVDECFEAPSLQFASVKLKLFDRRPKAWLQFVSNIREPHHLSNNVEAVFSSGVDFGEIAVVILAEYLRCR